MDLKLTEKEAQTIWQRIDTARRFTEKEVHPDLKRACDLYSGYHWPNMRKAAKDIRIVSNICQPAVETKVANLAFNYPDFVMRPLNREGAAHADIAKHVIRYDWRMADAQCEMRRSLRDREIYGVGITYDFWLWETQPVEAEPGVRVEGGRPAEAMEPMDTTPDMPPPEPALDGESLQVRTDRPAVRRISPYRFFVSPECDAKIENAEFCGFSEWVPVEEVKRDKRFKNTKNLVGNSKGLRPWMDEKSREMEDTQTPADYRRVRLDHYFEKNRKVHAVYCDEHQKCLMSEPWRWDGDWYPFVVQRAADEEDKFWPVPPLVRVEHQQREYNESRTQHSEWRRQASPKFQTKGTLDNKQRAGVRSSCAGEVIENVVEPLGAFPEVRLQPEVLEAGQLAMQDLRFALGLNDYETASPPTKRMTAPEVQAVAQSGGSRGVSDRQAFEMACSELAKHFLAWEQQYSVRSRELPIFDTNDRVEDFRDYTKDEIAGQFLVEVTVGSTTAPRAEDVLQQIGFLMQSLPGFVQAVQAAQMVGMDLRPVLPKLLRAALPDLRDIEQILLDQLSQPAAPALGLPPGAEAGIPMAGLPPEGGMAEPGAGPPPPEDAQVALAAMLGGLGG